MIQSPVPARPSTTLICIWARARVGGRLECRWTHCAPAAVCEIPKGLAAAA